MVALQLQANVSYTPTEKSEYLIRHYDVEDGLPVNSINGIVQDKNGYLYFSTYDGLIRYDGYEFEVYNSGNSPEIITNRQAGLLQASDGTLWIFNEGGTITSKKGELFNTFSGPDLPGLATRIIEGTDRRIWVAGTNGLAFYSEREESFQKLVHPLLETKINVLSAGFDNEVYYQAKDGLYVLSKDVPKLLLPDSKFSFAAIETRHIQLAGDNKLWVISETDAFLLDINKKEIEKTISRKSSELNFELSASGSLNGGTIFTNSSGYFSIDKKNSSVKELDLPFFYKEVVLSLFLEGKQGEEIFVGNNTIIIDKQMVLDGPNVRYVMLDNEGSLWVGTIAHGLYQIRKSSFSNISSGQIVEFENIYSVIEDDNKDIWACSFNIGIFHLSDNNYKLWNSINSDLPGRICKLVFEDENGTIFGSIYDKGLWKFDNGYWKNVAGLNPFLEGHGKSIEALHRKGEQLFIGNYNSLVVMENEQFRFFDETVPMELSRIQVFQESPAGILFVGTDGNGISRIEGDTFTSYQAKDGVLNSDTIRDIFLQSEDTLWAVNESIGLNRLILSEEGAVLSSKSITVKDGLSQNSLHKMLDDGLGNFWISGNSGIMRISKKELNRYADGAISELSVLSFNEKDGMINREANGGVQSSGIQASDGRLWFSNLKGITIIDPADFSVDYGLDVPPPVFETIELNEETLFISELDKVTIPDYQRDLRVNFTVPNFVNQDRINFSYRLEGVNDRWQDATSSHQAVFTGIPPGNHELKVRSQFIGGDQVEKSIIITIPPYFYETNWFMVLFVFGLIGLIYSGFRIRVRSLKETERRLKERVDIQTKELKEAAEQKQRFFTGITHELKTPLSLIISPLDDLVEAPEHTLDKAVSSRLSMMQRNSYRLKNLVDQILDVSKLNADAIKMKMQPARLPQLTRQIAGQFQSKLEQEEISINISTIEFSEYIYVDVEAWERITINLISNAIKFSPRRSTIELSFKEFESTIEMSIKDQGPGIAPEYHEKVFEYLYQVEGNKASEGTGIGLFLVKGLVEHMGGDIRLNSDLGKGAEFIVTLKKGHSHFKTQHELIHEPLINDQKVPNTESEVEEVLEDYGRTQYEHRILIVEDNADFRSYLKSVLINEYEVLLAENGKEALHILKETTPDLIISDIMMPEINGLEFVNTLRSKKPFEHLPVIFLSAKNEEQDVKTGLSTGADIYLSKPIRSSMLVSQVKAVLRREQILKNKDYKEAEADEDELVKKVREIVYRQLANPSLSVNQLADALFISRAKLYADWKKVSSTTVNDFVKEIRMNEAKILIKSKGFTVQEAARAVGFSDPNYFSVSFKKHFKKNPSEV